MTAKELTQQTTDQFVGAAHGDFDTVRDLLAQHPALVNRPATWQETPIEAAAQMARRDIAELLLAAGAPLSICTAAALGMKDKVAEMLNGDPSLASATGAHGIGLVYHVAISGRIEMAELVLARGGDVNMGEGGNTALHGAVMFGNLEMAHWLLDHGADVNAKDYEGKTALAAALKQNNSDIAELLKAHGGVE